MLRSNLFVDKARKLAIENMGKGRLLVYALDYENFTIISHYYGKERAAFLIENTLSYLRDIPTCLLCENIEKDNFLALVLVDSEIDDNALIERFDYVQNDLLKREDKEMPAYVLRMWCGICEVTDDNLELTAMKAEVAKEEAKICKICIPNIYVEKHESKMIAKRKKELDIVEDLQNKNFTYYLQPKVDLRDGTIIGVEALARRLLPNGKIGTPDTFVEILENNRLIVDLDCLILEKVCSDMEKRIKNGDKILPTSINLALYHIYNPKAPKGLDRIVKKYGISPKYIKFELTEDLMMHEYKMALSAGKELKELGYSRAIDDFGSGFSGINLWRHLEFEELKLDMTFLTEEPLLDGKNNTIILGIAKTNRLLNIDLIAEGVETKQQCRQLLQAGCHYGQGYYFSRPLPAEEFYSLYEKNDGRFVI